MNGRSDSFAPDSALVAEVLASPNHGTRAGTSAPDMIVLHYTGMATAEAALARLRAPEHEVSAHYVVREDGAIVQLVPEARRAWHAGRACWAGARDLNSCSIGIEIVNPGHDFGYPDFPDRQIGAVIALARDITARWPVPPTRVLAHSDVAPLRKIDPGEKFPWERLREAGVGHLVAEAPARAGACLGLGDHGDAVEALQAKLALYGYEVPVSGTYCPATQAVVTAFQRHFRRSRVDGRADPSTCDTLALLLSTRPPQT